MITAETVLEDDYPVVDHAGYTAAQLGPYRRLGIGHEEAAELLSRKDKGDRNVTLIIKARAHGIPRADIDAMIAAYPGNSLNRAARAYIQERIDGRDHAEASSSVNTRHFCWPAQIERYGEFCRVLGTGERTTVARCECGEVVWRNTERKNRSGD